VKPDIVGIGTAVMDRLYLLEDVSALPSGRVLQYSVQGGGPAATAIAAASVLGARCGMIAAVGGDEAGRFIMSSLEECGVDVSRMVVKPDVASPVVLVLVDARTGDRHFLGHGADSPLIGPNDIDWDYVAGARIVHFDGWVREMPAAMRKTRELGPTVMVDANVVAGLEPGWISLVDVFIGSADVRRKHPDPDAALKEAENIASLGPRTAILTLGARGCVGVGPRGPFRVPGLQVDVVDTTGTGDVFHGAYAYALLRGWEPEDCARFACAAAALSATRLGGRAGLASFAQVCEFLRSRGATGPWDAQGPPASGNGK